MLVNLPYGKEQRSVQIPKKNVMGVFTPAPPEKITEEYRLIAEALEHPVGTPRLRSMVRADMKIVIIADDKTRPTPVSEIISQLLEELSVAGVDDDSISIVFALGTHTPMTRQEMEKRAGSAAQRVKLFNSEFSNPAGLKDCGTAPDGVRVLVDKRVAEADFRIAVGSIMPHPECGWGGGGKMIYPGVASEETVTAFHLSFAHVDWNSYGSDKAPVRLNMEKWVDTVGLDFIVNTVITADNRVYKAVAGHYVAAHRKGIEYGRQIYTVTLPELPDIVLLTSYRAD
ncbi:MAG: nickel-dependent lactate racemase, partial [Spirochaetaceae bacterium]|nr:nickel-dependent lactate racemase [Spirochaetaceae bacterium]